MNHTPEPWRVREHPDDPNEFHVSAPVPAGHPYEGRTKEMEVMSDELYPTKRADAERIVACVNVCKGIVNPETAIPVVIDALKRAQIGYHVFKTLLIKLGLTQGFETALTHIDDIGAALKGVGIETDHPNPQA